MIIFTHQQSPAEAAQKLVKAWNFPQALYKQYLKSLKSMEKADPTQKLPDGLSVKEEIKWVKSVLKSLN